MHHGGFRSSMYADNFWSGRNVFITGATGLLGSWLTNEIVTKKANVVCLVRDELINTNFDVLRLKDKVTIINGDVENLSLVLRSLNEYEINTIFHLAAQTIVGTANKSPLSTFETNIKGTWNILESARDLDTERVIIASSDKAYGSHEKLPYTEDAKLTGSHPYDVSKSCADLIAQAYYKTYGLPVGITRCGNIYGGGDLNFSRIIPGTINSIMENQPPIIRSDGKYIRDYFYVKDAVNSYLVLAEKLLEEGITGEAFNFGTENPISVLKLVEMIINLSGKRDITPKILNGVHNEIKEQYLSCEKARTLLNWKPKYTLHDGLKETYNWYEEYFQRKLC